MAVDPITGAIIADDVPPDNTLEEGGATMTAALINPSPSPFAVPEIVGPTDEEISLEIAKGSVPTDRVSAKDTPEANLKFQQELPERVVEGNPLPNRVGNELTRLENGAIEDIQRLARLNNFVAEVRSKLSEEEQKKADSLMIPSR